MTFQELCKKYGLADHGNCIGNGWVPLAENLIIDLKSIGWDGNIGQIKEKFGVLRWYIEESTSAMYERIYEAEAESSKICEDCGAKGSTVSCGGWIRTVCTICYDAHMSNKFK